MPLPPRRRAALPGVRERRAAEEGATTRSRSHELHFTRPLEKERIGLGRWTAMFLGLFGSYGKNDSVDVQYRARRARRGGHRAGHHPARPTLTRLCQGSNLRRHAHRPILEQPPPRASRSSSSRRRPTRASGRSRATLEVLKEDTPDYVSVTYGAGGTTRDRTVEITKWIKQDLGIEAMAHLSLRGRGRGAARGDPRRAPGRRHRERAGAARRPAARRDRVEAAPRRAPLLDRADPT